MRIRYAVGLAAVWTMVAGVAAAQNMAPPISPLAQAVNEFAIDLYGQLRQQPGNLVFSPFSVANALEMVFLGAKGETADEMASVLHLQALGAADLPATLVQYRRMGGAQRNPSIPRSNVVEN